MAISRKKKRQILRGYPRRTPEELARNLRLDEEEVRAVLAEAGLLKPEGAALRVPLAVAGGVAVLVVAGGVFYAWWAGRSQEPADPVGVAPLASEAPQNLFNNPMIRRIDSLTTADHPMIDQLWHGRQEVATVVIAPPDGLLPYRCGMALARAELALRRRFGKTLRQLRRRRGPRTVAGRLGFLARSKPGRAVWPRQR